MDASGAPPLLGRPTLTPGFQSTPIGFGIAMGLRQTLVGLRGVGEGVAVDGRGVGAGGADHYERGGYRFDAVVSLDQWERIGCHGGCYRVRLVGFSMYVLAGGTFRIGTALDPVW